MEIITTVFYFLIVKPITNNLSVEFFVTIILTAAYPGWILYLLIKTVKPRIINSFLAPIGLSATPRTTRTTRPTSKYRHRHSYYHVKDRRQPNHCSSRRSRTGCRFNRSSSRHFPGGGGCGISKHKFLWKVSCLTRPKSGCNYQHRTLWKVIDLTRHKYYCSSKMSANGSTIFQQACSSSKELFFFDSIDTIDDILFEDSLSSHPIDNYHTCFDYSNDGFFFNRYKETHIEFHSCYDCCYNDNFSNQFKQPGIITIPDDIDDSFNNPPSLSFPSHHMNHFLESFNILEQSRLLSKLMPSLTISSSYTLLTRSDPRYTVILLEARHLQLNLSNYDERADMPMHQPAIYHSNKPDELPIVIDTGASCSLTPIHSDFIGTIEPSTISTLNNISGKTPVVGQGQIEWNIQDVNGIVKPIQTTAYYVPSATIRLFSPQVYINDDKTNSSEMILKKNKITFILSCGTRLQFPINQRSNLPIMLTEAALNSGRKKGTFTSFHIQDHSAFQPTTDRLNLQLLSDQLSVYQTTILDKSLLRQDNINLSPSSKELLLWHCRLGHAEFQRILSILAKPESSRGSEDKGELVRRKIHPVTKVSNALIPKCIACSVAKLKRTTPDSNITLKNNDREGVILQNKLFPGEKISCDHYMSSTLGRLPHTKGKEDKATQYVGGTLFVDFATNYIFHHHQVNLTAAATVRSKHECERHFMEHGFKVQGYLADNNPFQSKLWTTDCKLQQQQHTTFSGVGAKHQNYVERHQQTIFNWSRAMLLHFVLHWPQQANENLWPFFVDHAVYLWNNLPSRNDPQVSPKELFTNVTYDDYRHLQRAHVIGCPVFVLDPKLQDSKKIPKWNMRSRRGVYLGISKHHSTTVHLVLNPSTGDISPQYHVLFDDYFSTVFSNGNFDPTVWESLVVSNKELEATIIQATDGTIIEPPDHQSFDATPVQQSIPSNLPEGASAPTSSESEGAVVPPNTRVPANSELDNHQDTSTVTPIRSPWETIRPTPTPSVSLPTPESVTTEVRRSSRRNKGQHADRLIESCSVASYLSTNNISLPNLSLYGSSQTTYTKNNNNRLPRIPTERLNANYISGLKWKRLTNLCHDKLSTLNSLIVEHQQYLTTLPSGTQLVEYLNPALYITVANQDDNPTLTEAMNGPDAAGFFRAMELELETLIKMEVFTVVDRKPWMKVISTVWAFKRKRFPDGDVRKLKARLCARGFEQVEGRDYFETYAPVVQWLTVRLILVMTIIMGLENKQIDYTAAFVQAPIDTDVYIEMPRMFSTQGKVWKLRKSIYGLKQSPRNYFLHMKQKLEKLGFTQSNADPCLFISSTVICLVYVDDALLVYKDQLAVDDLTKRMEDEKMLFNVESDVAGYLGVLIDRHTDGTIVMKQSGLANRIIEALHLDDSSSTPTDTPCTAFLPIDEAGTPATGLYNYASIVGMLSYLQGHSRIDISLAVSQVARFVHSPKQSHEEALERIGRYLKGTCDQGLILKPDKLDNLFTIDVYVDASFACGWGTELGTNPDSVKSRTGYIIEIMGCSVVWKSQLQTSIATSTMESEYTALSMALRAAIPLLDICISINHGLGLTEDKMLTFKTTIHEDNIGALTLARLEPGRHTPRSKFYALRLHWFRSWLKPREIEIIHVSTKDQKADYLTKPLTSQLFKNNRLLSMGW